MNTICSRAWPPVLPTNPKPSASVQLATAGGLAFLAGATDVHGLTLLHDLFVCFMSGNSTMLEHYVRGDMCCWEVRSRELYKPTRRLLRNSKLGEPIHLAEKRAFVEVASNKPVRKLSLW